MLIPFEILLIEVVVNINVLEEPIAFLITYVSWLSPKAVAEGFKLPIIDIQSTSICSFLVFAFFSHLLEKGYFPVQGPFSLCVACERVLVACLMACFNEVLENLMRECYLLHFSLSQILS